MEAVTIAGLAVVIVGGYYAVVDFMYDLGIHVKKSRSETKVASIASRTAFTSQGRVKKMAGMHV